MVMAMAGASCAAQARARPWEIVHRGVVLARGASISSLARGPALVHVYSEGAGGLVYIAAAAPDTGDGCRGVGREAPLAQAPLEPDRRLTVAVREGEVACLSMQSPRPMEVLWHTHRVSPVAPEYRLRAAALTAKQ